MPVSNRFSLIAGEEETDSFVELSIPSPIVKSTKKSNKTTAQDLPGKSSLEKVSNALKLKKQAEEEQIAHKAAEAAAREAARIAAAEKKAQETLASASAEVPTENLHRRTGKPNHRSRNDERERVPMTTRQREHAHGRENRSAINRKGDGEKKHGAGKGNWGKLLEDKEITSLAPFVKPTPSPVKEMPVEAVVPEVKPEIAMEKAQEVPIVTVPEPAKPSMLTYEQYLAEKARTALVIDIPRRKANEGNADNSQWKKAVPLVKKEENMYVFPGSIQEGQLTSKKRPIQTSVPSITVDPRLNIDFTKPSLSGKRPSSSHNDKKTGRPAGTSGRTNSTRV